MLLANLATSVRVPQNIVLGKVTMGRHDHNIEDHGNSAKELLEIARIRCLKKVQEELDHFEHALSVVTPTSLQTKILQLELKSLVWGFRCKCRQILLCLPQNMLEGIHILNFVIQHHILHT